MLICFLLFHWYLLVAHRIWESCELNVSICSIIHWTIWYMLSHWQLSRDCHFLQVMFFFAVEWCQFCCFKCIQVMHCSWYILVKWLPYCPTVLVASIALPFDLFSLVFVNRLLIVISWRHCFSMCFLWILCRLLVSFKCLCSAPLAYLHSQ